jgi:glycosyltransferase involved in cell wall biosynthesis
MALDGFGPQSPTHRALRVALFSGNYNYTLDGANLALNRLVGRLEQTGRAKVRVYSPTSDTPAFPPTGDLVSAPSFVIPGRSDYRFSLGLSRTLRRDVQGFDPELIHLSAPDLLGVQAQRFGHRRGVPIVASVHTLFDTYLDYYPLGWLKPAAKAWLRRFYAGCDYVLAPTQAIADQFEAAGLVGRTRIWSRGVDANRFSPERRDMAWRRRHGFHESDVVVTFCGRLVMEKGLAVFVEAVERAAETVPNLGCLVIGDGPARPWLEARLPRAVYTGFLTGDALSQAMASGDILLNPSRTEAFCNATLEAMASSLAVVAADAPNNRAFMRDGYNGVLRPGLEPAAFAVAIADLATDAAHRSGLARAARMRALDYQWDDILDQVGSVYREAIGMEMEPGRSRPQKNSHRLNAAKTVNGTQTVTAGGR